jgi:hypothetical protein
MLDNSNKENLSLEKHDPRLVTFHFCERYAKKSDRRIKTEMAEAQPRMVKGSKITLIAKGKASLDDSHDNKQRHKLSNFEILKRKISYLDSEQFLGDKTYRNALKETACNPEVDYVVTGEFGHSKRISVLEKYRKNIKNTRKDSERRKISLNLLNRAQPTDSYSKLALQFAPPTQVEDEGSDWLMKKREVVTQCAKRYFRPQSFHHRSREGGKLVESVAEVKGRRL